MSRDNVYKQVNNFNNIIKQLINSIAGKYDDVATYNTFKRRIFLLSSTDPTKLITIIGDNLFQLREHIKKDFNNFINTYSTNREVQVIIKKIEAEYEISILNEIFNTLFTIWVKFTDDEKKYIESNIKKLLSVYCQYKVESSKL